MAARSVVVAAFRVPLLGSPPPILPPFFLLCGGWRHQFEASGRKKRAREERTERLRDAADRSQKPPPLSFFPSLPPWPTPLPLLRRAAAAADAAKPGAAFQMG